MTQATYPEPPTHTCPCCRSSTWWRWWEQLGGWICTACHEAAQPAGHVCSHRRRPAGPHHPEDAPTMTAMPVHPAAELFPLMTADELEDLAESIRHHGLLNPVITYQGQVLDGRNRLRACAAAEVEPRFDEYRGAEPVAFVMAQNVERRRLTDDQHSAIAAEALPMFEAEARRRQGKRTDLAPPTSGPAGPAFGRARDQAGAAFGVSGRQVQRAKRLLEVDPELHRRVKAGTMTLVEAGRVIAQREAEACAAEADELDRFLDTEARSKGWLPEPIDDDSDDGVPADRTPVSHVRQIAPDASASDCLPWGDTRDPDDVIDGAPTDTRSPADHAVDEVVEADNAKASREEAEQVDRELEWLGKVVDHIAHVDPRAIASRVTDDNDFLLMWLEQAKDVLCDLLELVSHVPGDPPAPDYEIAWLGRVLDQLARVNPRAVISRIPASEDHRLRNLQPAMGVLSDLFGLWDSLGASTA